MDHNLQLCEWQATRKNLSDSEKFAMDHNFSIVRVVGITR